MTVNRKVTGTAVTIPAGVGIGGGISLLLTAVGACVVAKLISAAVIQENAIGYGAMMIILASSIGGSAIAVNKVKKRMLQVCALVGILYYVMLLAMTAVFFGGQYQGMGVTALLILAGCGAVILIAGRQRKPKKYGKGR